MTRPPSVRVRLPSVLRPLAGGRPELRGEGTTVGEVLRALGREHPALCERLLDAEGRLRRYVTFFLNGEDVRHAGGADAAVSPGDELTVVPALSGGRPQGAAASTSSEAGTGGPAELDPLRALAALAARSPREEVCGFVLAAPDGEGTEIVAVRNVAGDRSRAFEMDAREVLAVLRAAEERGRAVAAIFHSHVEGGAGLSAADRALLAPDGRPLWPGAELWVIALEGGKAELRVHAWTGDRYQERSRTRAPFTQR